MCVFIYWLYFHFAAWRRPKERHTLHRSYPSPFLASSLSGYSRIKKNHRKLRTGPNPKIIWNKYIYRLCATPKKKKKRKNQCLLSLNSYVCICSLYPWIFRVDWCSLCLQAFSPQNLLTSPLCNFFPPSHFFFSPTGMLPGGNERLASNTIATNMVSLNEFTR